MNNRVVIVLTACVNPNGMSFTKLQNAEIRRQHYINALHFYLEETNLPVVFVENTNTDLSGEFQEFIHNGRLEYLTFDGNNYDKIRGKGYGEALILIYAVEHSKFIKQSKYLLKITGRVIVRNVEKLSKSKVLLGNHVFRCNMEEKHSISTVVFICRPNDLLYFLKKHLEEITEYPRGFWLERIVYRGFVKDNDSSMCIVPFFEPPFLDGIYGTFGKPYCNKALWTNIADNLFFLSNLLKERKFFCKYIIILIIYYFVLFLRRIRLLV